MSTCFHIQNASILLQRYSFIWIYTIICIKNALFLKKICVYEFFVVPLHPLSKRSMVR